MHRIFTKRDPAAAGGGSRRRRTRRQRPSLEALEGRQLLSLSPTVLPVNTITAGSQSESDTASSASGVSVVVWTTDGVNGPSVHDIHAQMFFSDGSKKGQEIVVNNIHAQNHHPRVAMNSSGEFVVGWEADGFISPGGNFAVIESKFFDNTGHSSQFQHDVSNGSFELAHDPDVAIDAFGNFVVSYTVDSSSTDRNVRALEFDRNDIVLSDIGVGVSTIGDETNSSVAINPTGGFDIAYQFQIHGTNDPDIILNQYGSNGAQIGSPHVIANSTSSEANPSVATDAAGNAVVVYQKFVGKDFDIMARRVSSIGAVAREITVRNTGAQELRPAVAVSPTGGAFVVAYNTDVLNSTTGNKTVEVREFNASDAPGLGFNLPASPNNAAPALSINQGGGYRLTYTAGVGSDSNVVMQLGQLPTAPQAKNLALTPSIHPGQSATLTGRLVDADGDTKLTLTVSWGDGSRPQQSKPGTKPFAVTHKYAHAGTYTVHVTWTDSTGLSNSRDLKVTVKAK